MRAKEIVQRVRTCTVLTKDQGSAPGNPTGRHKQLLVIPAQGGFSASDCHGTYTCVCVHVNLPVSNNELAFEPAILKIISFL